MIPKIDLPIYELKLPSTGKAVKVRPFIVKEEKLLLIAAESNDNTEIIETTKQVINNCLVGDNVNIETLPFFDVDYLFIALRAKSVGEAIDIKFTCNNVLPDGNPCGANFPAKIDIANCKVIKNNSIKPEIYMPNDTMVKMKYPNYTTMKLIMGNSLIINKKINIIVGSIDLIKQKDKIYTNKDLSKEELIQFVEGLTQEHFKKLEEFVDNFPSFVITTKAKCSKCQFKHELEYREFTSFFV
jgi:hypothetical protein